MAFFNEKIGQLRHRRQPRTLAQDLLQHSDKPETKKRKAEPSDPALMKLIFTGIYYFFLRLAPARPSRPVPSRSMVVGSGTDDPDSVLWVTSATIAYWAHGTLSM